MLAALLDMSWIWSDSWATSYLTSSSFLIRDSVLDSLLRGRRDNLASPRRRKKTALPHLIYNIALRLIQHDRGGFPLNLRSSSSVSENQRGASSRNTWNLTPNTYKPLALKHSVVIYWLALLRMCVLSFCSSVVQLTTMIELTPRKGKARLHCLIEKPSCGLTPPWSQPREDRISCWQWVPTTSAFINKSGLSLNSMCDCSRKSSVLPGWK